MLIATSDIMVVGKSKIVIKTLETGPEPKSEFTILILRKPNIFEITVNNMTRMVTFDMTYPFLYPEVWRGDNRAEISYHKSLYLESYIGVLE